MPRLSVSCFGVAASSGQCIPLWRDTAHSTMPTWARAGSGRAPGLGRDGSREQQEMGRDGVFS